MHMWAMVVTVLIRLNVEGETIAAFKINSDYMWSKTKLRI